MQRVLKFVKYLPQFGWEPIILTVKKGEYPAIDFSLEKSIPETCKVYRVNSLEPGSLYKFFTGMKKDEIIPVAALAEKGGGWKKRLSHWIRKSFFIPDAKIGWIPFAVQAGKKIILEENPDIIFSSSPPPTVHLIARKLAKWSGLKWVADFRDPWTDIYHYDKNKLPYLSKFINLAMEKKVLDACNALTTVSEDLLRLFSQKISFISESQIISNGYDEDDLPKIEGTSEQKYFHIMYAGKMNKQQDPDNFWKVLKERINSDKSFKKYLKISTYGHIESDIIKTIEEYGLSEHVEFNPYIEYQSLLKILNTATALLLLIPDTKKNKGILTGKLFDYLGLRKPIIGIGPSKGDAAEIINGCNSGKMLDFDNHSMIKEEIERMFYIWKANSFIPMNINETELKKYSRENQAKQLTDLMKKIV